MNETFCHVNFVMLLQSVFLQTTGPRETFLACYTYKKMVFRQCDFSNVVFSKTEYNEYM